MYRIDINIKKIFLIGILLRVLLCFWTGNPDDFETFIRVGYYVSHGISPTQSSLKYVNGLGQPTYTYVSGIGYSSFWGLITAFSYKIYSLNPFSPFFYYFLLKLFPILGDIAITYVIYLILKKLNLEEKYAEKTSLIFLLCPFVIIISSVWGMFDSIPVLFTLISILMLLHDKPYLSSFSLALGIYIKIIPIIYLPLILLFIYDRKGLKDAVLCLIITLCIPFYLIMAPLVFYQWSLSEAVVTLFSQTQRLGGGLTYWNIFNLINLLFPHLREFNNTLFLFPPIRYLWLFGIIFSYVLYRARDREKSNEITKIKQLIEGFMMTTIAFLLTRIFIAEQYILYLLPFFLLLNKYSHYKYIWYLATIYTFLNYHPFVFAYMIDIGLWKQFKYMLNTMQYAFLRYFLKFVIAIVFDLSIMKIFLEKEIKL